MELSDFLKFIYAIDIKKQDSKKVFLGDALHLNLAKDIECIFDIPRFNNSAMDGYAIKINQNKYEIKGSIFAGDKEIKDISFNEAYEITTGARVPNGCDAVIQKELIRIENNELFFNEMPKKGLNIKLQGECFKKGEILFKKGRKLDVGDIATIASQGLNEVEVYKRPRILMFSSGNEVVETGKNIDSNQIYDVNFPFLRAFLKSFNFDLVYGGILKDSAFLIYEKLLDGIKNFDIVVTSGSLSVGARDHMKEVLLKLGANILVDKLNIKPGGLVMLSRIESTFILSLPGNPIASFFNFALCIPVLLEKMSGGNNFYIKSIKAKNKLPFKLKKKNNANNIILGEFKDGYFYAYNSGVYGSSNIKPLSFSNSFCIFSSQNSEDSEDGFIEKDRLIDVILYKYSFLATISSIIN